MLKPKHYVKKKVDRINPLDLLCTFSNNSLQPTRGFLMYMCVKRNILTTCRYAITLNAIQVTASQ